MQTANTITPRSPPREFGRDLLARKERQAKAEVAIADHGCDRMAKFRAKIAAGIDTISHFQQMEFVELVRDLFTAYFEQTKVLEVGSRRWRERYVNSLSRATIGLLMLLQGFAST